MKIFQRFRRFFRQRKIARRRSVMYPNGHRWRQISPGMWIDRLHGVERYLRMRRVRESKRYYREVLWLSEEQIREIYKEPAAQ